MVPMPTGKHEGRERTMTNTTPTKSFPKLIEELVAIRREVDTASRWMRELHAVPHFWCNAEYLMVEELIADAATRLRIASAAFIEACRSSSGAQ